MYVCMTVYKWATILLDLPRPATAACLTLTSDCGASYLDQRLRRVAVDAVVGVDVGVGAGVEGEVDRRYVGSYRAGH